MSRLFNKIFYNKDITKKAWTIKGVQTDPKQKETDTDIMVKDANLKLILTKEKGVNGIITTIQVNDQEYSFMLYDEIIDYINKIKEKEEVAK